MSDTASGNGPIIIKKYPNRRLYDTLTSSYVTLEDLQGMVKQGLEFTVIDAKTGDDLTRMTLTQIIFDLESQGYNLLPISFLRHIIGFYGDNISQLLPPYLESMMDNFMQNQEQIRDSMGMFGDFSPFKQLEEIGKQNMEFFTNTMNMFTPFNYAPEAAPDEGGKVKNESKPVQKPADKKPGTQKTK